MALVIDISVSRQDYLLTVQARRLAQDVLDFGGAS